MVGISFLSLHDISGWKQWFQIILFIDCSNFFFPWEVVPITFMCIENMSLNKAEGLVLDT